MPFELPTKNAHDATELEHGWRAELNCRFARHGERTVIAHREHYGPLLVQRAFYPESTGVCHVCLVHPPGGIVGGDRLRFEAHLATGAQTLITTPAATKLYRSNGALAEQHTHLTVHAGASLEWLPQETIVFSGAEAEVTTRVELREGARFMGWEVMCLGRPANQERFLHGRVRQRFEIWREQWPVWIERSEYLGDDEALSEAWGLASQPVFGTLVATVDQPDAVVMRVRDQLRELSIAGRCVVTALDQVVVCRYVGPWAETARAYLSAAWQCLCPLTLGREAVVPRIWNT